VAVDDTEKAVSPVLRKPTARAERFDICRNATGHVGLGGGIHGCVGQLIARLEGEIVLTLLAKRVRSLELAGTPTIHLNSTLRTWSSIPVRVAAA
jgi:4-methoxybenzoate monooxygenase (O-demethylating)